MNAFLLIMQSLTQLKLNQDKDGKEAVRTGTIPSCATSANLIPLIKTCVHNSSAAAVCMLVISHNPCHMFNYSCSAGKVRCDILHITRAMEAKKQ